jgi:tetratricopeptide (TPR) repeat protein
MMPVCFMVMPYGTKPNPDAQRGPATINFNALWEKALRPFIVEDLKYEAIRADQELGALIILEMIERLAVADLVIADITIPNGNVYYEVGVRHAAREIGCVMVAADWSRQLFDIDQMRRVVYPMPEGEISDETAAAIRAKLRENDALANLAKGKSPVYQCLPWYPGQPPQEREQQLKQFVDEVSAFQQEAIAARRAPKAERVRKALDLRDKYASKAAQLPVIATELMYVLRDAAQWQAVLDYIEGLPEKLRMLPVMQEQKSLAESKTGDHLKAIAALEQLIENHGDSSERRGLLGGRYKKLYATAIDPDEKAGYLDNAIEQYTRGMELDLNDYYPSSNLPRLLRIRGYDEDEQGAQMAASIALKATQRAKTRNPNDEWINPTLLGAAFDAGNVAEAKRLFQEIRRVGAPKFHLDTTIPDLKLSVELTQDAKAKAGLAAVLTDLERLV